MSLLDSRLPFEEEISPPESLTVSSRTGWNVAFNPQRGPWAKASHLSDEPGMELASHRWPPFYKGEFSREVVTSVALRRATDRVLDLYKEGGIERMCAERAIETLKEMLCSNSFSPEISAVDGEVSAVWYAGNFSIELSIPGPPEKVYVRRVLPRTGEKIDFVDNVEMREREALHVLRVIVERSKHQDG